MKKGLIAVLSVVLSAAAGAGGYYQFIYKGSSKAAQESDNAVYVTVVSALTGTDDTSGTIQRYAGVVEPQKTVDVKVSSDKKIEETYVREGDTVKEGDKLFKYNTTEDEDKIEKDKIEIERDKNNIESSNASIKELQAQQAKASANDQLTYTTRILQEQNNVKQYEYDIKTRQLEIDSCQANINNAVVTSEMDGVVKSVNSSSSSSLNSDSDSGSSDVYMTIMAVGAYRIKGTLNEQLNGNLYEGDKMIAFSRVDNSQTWTGTISQINYEAGTSGNNSDSMDSTSSSGSSTNYPFYVELDSSDGLILGQHVYLEVDQGQLDRKDGLWIDEYYINKDDDGTAWVWAASDQDTLKKRTVETGEYDEEQAKYEILSGLTKDDYITANSEGMKEGTPVIKLDYVSDDSGMEGIDGNEYYGGSYNDYTMEGDTENYGEIYNGDEDTSEFYIDAEEMSEFGMENASEVYTGDMNEADTNYYDEQGDTFYGGE